MVTTTVARRPRREPSGNRHADHRATHPVDVVESDEFAWHIPGFAAELRALAAAPR